MIRLGFPVRIVARPGLGGGSGRAAPHLSVTLARLADVLGYLRQIEVSFYRAALGISATGGLAELAACAPQLETIAEQLARAEMRVSVHLDHTVALGADNPALAAEGLAVIEATAALLAALDARRPPGTIEGTMVAHVGGPAADPASLGRFAERFGSLSPLARARLGVEHDGAGHSLGRLLALHQRCGVPVVFDALHFALHNPEHLPLDLALGLALATWPPQTRPEVHLSSARSEAHLLPAAGRPTQVLPPRPGQHADFIVAADLERLLVASVGLPPFDLMLEAKAGDLALLRLRAEIAARAPALAARLG